MVGFMFNFAGGELVTAFVHDADAPVTFRVSMYTL